MLHPPSNPARAAQFAAATLLGLLGAGAGAPCGVAAESEGRFAPVVRPAEGDSITVSKKEFDAVKSSRDPALQPKGDVPRLSAPEMSTGISGFSGLPATKPTDPKEKKPANWLIDAMEKSASADRNKRSSRGLADGERERDSSDNPLTRSAGDAAKDGSNSARDSDSGNAKEDNDRKTTTVVNPLDRYLAGWMSPQDYALLKPGLTEAANGGRAGGKDALSSLPQAPGTMGLPGANTISALVPGAPAPLIAPPPPKANPYLEALNAPAPIPAVTYVPPAVVTPAPKVPVFAAPPPAPIDPAKSKLPDFVKPAQDEKYYKQLKRF